MSAVTQSAQRLDVLAARRLVGRTEIVVVDQAGQVIERVALLRYAGASRTSGAETFAIKDADGKFRVRSASKLGLSDDSAYVAYIATDFDSATGNRAA